MKEGALVEDQLVFEPWKANCDLENSVYIFDGFPRNIDQAELLDQQVLKSYPSLAISFEMDLRKIIERV